MTKEVVFMQGSVDFKQEINGKDVEFRHPKINIIDTVGFCDTVMTNIEVLTVIEDRLKTNLFHINRVVIVCAGRLEADHQTGIKKFMELLKYKKYKTNFSFVYNKCDGMEEGNTLKNLGDVCGMLKINPNTTIKNDFTRPTPLVIATGFPPRAPFQDIKNDLLLLQESIMMPTYETGDSFDQLDTKMIKRIPIHRYECTIL